MIDDSSQLPIGGVAVGVHDESFRLVAIASTDDAGNYDSGRVLAPGTYFARTNNGAGYLDELYDDIDCTTLCYLGEGTPISVAPGQTMSGIDFGLVRGGAISGRITDATTGEPIAAVLVEVYDDSLVFHGTALSDASGSYLVDSGLPSGTYYALTVHERDYIDELYDNLPCQGFCCPLEGTPIPVSVGHVTAGIDFHRQQL